MYIMKAEPHACDRFHLAIQEDSKSPGLKMYFSKGDTSSVLNGLVMTIGFLRNSGREGLPPLTYCVLIYYLFYRMCD